MEDGFIQGARGVLFSPDEKIVFILKNLFSERDVRITGPFEHASPAYFCYACECLVWKKIHDEILYD